MFLESSATVGKSPDRNLGHVEVVDGMEVESLVMGTPTHGGRLHIGHKSREVRSESNCSMVLDVADVLLELS